MATRSTIALEFADGTVGQVYCHWDGYLSNNGKILLNHYMDPLKVRELIDLGDLSSLGPDIGEKHEFDNPHDFKTQAYLDWQDEKSKVCTFYSRDRDEEGVNARYFKDYADYVENGQSEEFNYILRQINGKAVWFVESYAVKEGEFASLRDAMDVKSWEVVEV